MLLRTRRTQTQIHLPNFAPTPHKVLITSTCNFNIVLGEEGELQHISKRITRFLVAKQANKPMAHNIGTLWAIYKKFESLG